MSEHLVNTNEKTPFPKSAEDDITTKPAVEGALKEGDKVALVGNPNVGKSVIFGVLTGRYVTVSNYPGTTVEVSRGKARIENCKVEVVDTPGANGLLPMSEDEEVTRNILLDEDIKKVILVADSKNLERSLHMAIQLCEFRIPFVIALNMSDEARSAGIEIDPAVIKDVLGWRQCPL
jgi:ferrous iron transport protein B